VHSDSVEALCASARGALGHAATLTFDLLTPNDVLVLVPKCTSAEFGENVSISFQDFNNVRDARTRLT